MAAVLACSGIGESLSGPHRQAKSIIKLAKGEQASIGRDLGAVELQLEAVIEGDPESNSTFTRRTAHVPLR